VLEPKRKFECWLRESWPATGEDKGYHARTAYRLFQHKGIEAPFIGKQFPRPSVERGVGVPLDRALNLVEVPRSSDRPSI
jgi:hypothetical protein